MEFTKEFIETFTKMIYKDIKNASFDRVEDAVQWAFQCYLEKEARGEEIIEPWAYLTIVARRKYYTLLKRDQKHSNMSELGDKVYFLPVSNQHLESSFLGEQNKDVLLALSQGHTIREVAEAYGLTYYRVREIKENWINS